MENKGKSVFTKTEKIKLSQQQKDIIIDRYPTLYYSIIRFIERWIDKDTKSSLDDMIEDAFIYLDDHFGGPNLDLHDVPSPSGSDE